MNCRFCKTPLTHEFIDLGESPPSNSYLLKEELSEHENYFLLKLFVCENCFLVQIDEHKKATEIFNKEYAYFSSFSTSWLAHAKAYTEMMVARFHFNSKSQIIEIASNDGYLLQYFKEKNISVMGIEPTANTAAVAKEKGIESVIDYFGTSLAKKLITKNIYADLLLGNNVLAHVPNINDFVGGMKIILKKDGIITMEFPHLYQMVEQNQFDTIYHEHFSYLSFTTVRKIFAAQGLELFDVQEIPTHGGSLRIFAKHSENKNQPISDNVEKLLLKEKNAGMNEINYYKGFQEKAIKVKNDLLKFLLEQKRNKKNIAAYGAAAKGNTLLNYCGIKNDLINFVVDASPHKQGKYMPASHIPIVNEAEIRNSKPDFIIILPWNIKDEIMKQLSYVKEWNCKFVIPIPAIEII